MYKIETHQQFYATLQEKFYMEAFEKAWSKINGYNRRPDPWTFDLTFLQGRLEDEWKEYAEAKTLQEKADELLDIANFCFYLRTAITQGLALREHNEKP